MDREKILEEILENRCARGRPIRTGGKILSLTCLNCPFRRSKTQQIVVARCYICFPRLETFALTSDQACPNKQSKHPNTLVADLVREAGHEGLEDVADQIHEVDRHVADGAAERGVRLQHRPRLGVLQVLVAQVRDLHRVLQTRLQMRAVHRLVVPTPSLEPHTPTSSARRSPPR